MYAAVDKRVSAAYRDRLIKCYGLEYEDFNVCVACTKTSLHLADTASSIWLVQCTIVVIRLQCMCHYLRPHTEDVCISVFCAFNDDLT